MITVHYNNNTWASLSAITICYNNDARATLAPYFCALDGVNIGWNILPSFCEYDWKFYIFMSYVPFQTITHKLSFLNPWLKYTGAEYVWKELKTK